MTRIGKQPVSVPDGVEVKINGCQVVVKGPKGSLTTDFHPRIKFEHKDKIIKVSVESPEEKTGRELWGLSRMLLHNMIMGVTNGYSKQLEINGVGFKAAVAGKKLTLNVGFAHPVDFAIPEGIEIKVEKNIITVTGIDKQKVGQVAALIREIKKPEPYKGKGIKYVNETIRRKAGKVMKTAGSE